jgi:hypothetical protein
MGAKLTIKARFPGETARKRQGNGETDGESDGKTD